MEKLGERKAAFLNNRWLVFVAAMWLQSLAGIGYLFGSIPQVIKVSLGYNQRQLAGFLCGIILLWAALLIGAVANFVGYG